MVSDLAFEFEEPEPVEASHLLRVNCCACGTPRSALAAPGQERVARCAGCMGTSVSGGIGNFGYTPAVGYPSHPAPSGDENVCPVCRVTSRKKECNWLRPGAHPAPSVSSRAHWGAEYPSAVLKLAERAREALWEVRQQYARGCGVHGGTGRPLAEADSFALVFYGHPLTDAGAYAVYSGGSWKSINIAGRALGTVTDLDHWLSVGGAVEPLWFEHVQALQLHAEYLKAQVKLRDAEIKKLAGSGVSVESLVLRYELSAEDVIKIIKPKRASGKKGEQGG